MDNDNPELFDGVIRVLQAQPGARVRLVVIEVDGAAVAGRSPAPPAIRPSSTLEGEDRVFKIKWNVQGHGAIAHVALETIIQQEAPNVYAKLKVLMKHDPLSRRDIVEMSQWPDRIKPPAQPEYRDWSWLGTKHRTEHYVNYPVDPDAPQTTPPAAITNTSSLLDALPIWCHKLKHETDPTERGHALAFITHLVGDIHQPLHCGVLVGSLFPLDEFPEGDRGGNQLWWGDTQKFHSYWDGLVCRTKDQFAGAVATLEDGLERSNFKTELARPGFDSWGVESYRLATEVYRRFLADAKYLHRDTRTKRDGDDEEGQLFESPSKAYREWAREVAFQQGRIAAFRLADTLIQHLE